MQEQLQFLRPGWGDVAEILIVAFLLYRALVLIQRTRAMQILGRSWRRSSSMAPSAPWSSSSQNSGPRWLDWGRAG
jgi:hypothetical protein